MERPVKRAKLDSDSDSEASEGETIQTGVLSINKDFARRFEHNKQREEKQRLEEKYKEDSDESSSDETEDDDADLVTPDLDQEILRTLNAIKSRDPRVYDESTTFYRPLEEIATNGEAKKGKQDVPMTLKDYHRENILAGYTGEQEDDIDARRPITYQEEQDDLRQNVVSQLNALAEDDGEDDDFTVKRKGVHEKVAAPARTKITTADVAAAGKDPETFLSNFMAAQAWRPTAGQAATAAFDSDDSEDDARADAFEEAYNMRFEDPATANEKLKSFARDAGQYSVRREAQGGRKRAREREREEKELAKQERAKERERLKKLKVNEAEEKLDAIRHAAGLSGQNADVQEWRELIEGDFDDTAWDAEMRKRFGEQYYATSDADGQPLDNEPKATRPKKPKWDDDIDVADIAPGLNDGEDGGFELTDEETNAPTSSENKKTAKLSKEKQKQETKQARKSDKRLLEQMVEASLPAASASQGAFRYRETSPTSFGMQAQDILFASDAQLNEFAGLKKLAPFRDADRKAKDRKRLNKKARLREWRKEVFGKADPDFDAMAGPAMSEDTKAVVSDKAHNGSGTSSKKRKRKSNNKSTA